MISNRDTIILYSSSLCNLQCSYCYIDKSQTLKDINKLLVESYADDYYLNFAKKVFPNEKQVRCLQVWGGEPFIGMRGALPTIKKLFLHYVNCTNFMVSTNFVLPNVVEEIQELINTLGSLDRQIELNLQLSIDGPKSFTDMGRGEGVTDKFIKNFDKLIRVLRENKSKIRVNLMLKPTLTSETIKMLQTYEDVYAYYSFFEDFICKFNSIIVEGNTASINVPLPNTACPSPHTKNDGILFYNFCKICKDIEKTGNLRYYTRIVPFPGGKCNFDTTSSDRKLCGYLCNTGRGMVGLLPKEMISECHMAFIDMLGDLKKTSVTSEKHSLLDSKFFMKQEHHPMTFSFDKLEDYERKIDLFYREGATARLSVISNQIMLEAFVGNINIKYADEHEAVKAARFLTEKTSYCIRDNINVNGSMSGYPAGLIRLFFNGAEDYLI